MPYYIITFIILLPLLNYDLSHPYYPYYLINLNIHITLIAFITLLLKLSYIPSHIYYLKTLITLITLLILLPY